MEEDCSDYYVSGYSAAGTWKTLSSQPSSSLTGPWIYYVNSYARSYGTFTTGNTYTYTFRQQFDPKSKATLDTIPYWRYDIYGMNGSTLSDNYIASQSCSTRNVPTHNYAVETTCSFTLNTNVSYILVRTAFKTTMTGSRFTISNFQCQSSQSEVGAINELNATIKAQFQILISSIFESDKKTYDYLSDDSNANVNVNQMTGITGILPPGPLDSLLTLPINVLTIIVNNSNNTCQPFTFNFVFNQEFSFPCFDIFWDSVPNELLFFLSDLPAVYIFMKWAKSIYKRVERAVMFESSVDDEWGGI